MTPPPWLKIVQELSEKYPRECTQVLATLTQDRLPSSRYIVHRKLHLPTDTSSTPLFISTTDVRSPKASQLAADASCNVTWWLPTTNIQFRVDGTAQVVGHNEAERGEWEETRQEIWGKLKGFMRASFARPVAPGTELESYEEMESWPRSLPELSNAKDEIERQQCIFAYSNFSLVIVKPTALDYVELNVVPNKRTAWKLVDGEWKTQILCP